MIDYDVKRLYISVHDPVGVGVFKSLQDFVSVKPDVHLVELIVELFCFNVWNVLKDQTRRFCLAISEHIVEFDNVGASVERLKDFRFSINFLSSHRFQNLDYTGLVFHGVDSLENF